MKSRAAVLRGAGKEWEIQEVDLDPPHAGEVLVKVGVAGICHSDDHFATGDSVPNDDMVALMRAAGVPMPSTFPMIGGHEGAGVVVEVGEGVTALQPGDHVATSFIPACGRCRWCVTGQSNICDAGAHLNDKEMTTDGTVRRHLGDEALLAMMQVGTFSEYVVASERSLVKIEDDVPFHAAALVSCGATTGWGSATVAAGTETGDTVVVIGVGGVGMSAVQGARAAGATRIIAVDPVESKRAAAPSFGATHTSPSAAEAIELVRDLTRGVMADRVVVTAGVVHTDLIPVAMMLTRKGGTCVLTGVVPLAEFSVPMILTDMIYSNKQLKGTLYGGMNPRADIPRLLSVYQSGGLQLDAMVTRRYRLDQINDAIEDLRAGRNIRGVVDFGLD